MKKIKADTKVPASTLLEVLVSMLIIMIVFSIAIGIYTRITSSQLSLSSRKAQQYMQRILAESKENKNWSDETLFADSISYKKTITDYPGYSDLLLISIQAEQNGKELAEMKEIVKKEDSE